MSALAFIAERLAPTAITSATPFSPTANTAAGNDVFLILGSSSNSTTSVSVVDSKSNVWSVDSTGSGANSGRWVGIAHAHLDSPITTSDTITVTWTTGTMIAQLEEFSSPGTLKLDKTASSDNNTGSTISCGTTIAITRATELVIGGFRGAGSDGTYTPGANYTIFNSSTTGAVDGMYRITSSITTYNPNITSFGGGSDSSVGATATYFVVHNYGFNTNNLRPHPFSPGLAR